jgi:hypothetical protein
MQGTLRAGVAAILAGSLYFIGQGGELVFDEPEWPFLVAAAGGLAAFGVALWELRRLMVTRVGRIGIRVALAGFVLLALFGVQVLIEQIRTGDIPENFVLFALGFLLVLIGQLLFARDLRHRVGWAWILPLVAVAGLVAALTVEASVIHDGGLFAFEAAWIALGAVLVRRRREVVLAMGGPLELQEVRPTGLP